MSKFPFSHPVQGKDYKIEVTTAGRKEFPPSFRYAKSGRSGSILTQFNGRKDVLTEHPLVVQRDSFISDSVELYCSDEWWTGKKIFWYAPVLAHLPDKLPGFLASTDPEADGNARNKLLNAILDQNVNLANAVGERKQTIDLLVNTARRIANSVMCLRKGNWAQAARHIGYTPSPKEAKRLRVFQRGQLYGGKPLANAWLELKYGWQPLLSDVYGSATALAARAAAGNLFEVARSTARGKSNSGGSAVFSSKVGGGSNKFTNNYSEVRDQVVKYYVKYKITDETMSTVSALGFINPLVVAWELTPFSFVVDWFLPIGNWLSTFGATAGKTFLSGWSSRQDRTRYTARIPGGCHTYERVTYTRAVLSDFPSGALPSFKNPVSGGHIANACALLVSAFKGHK